MQPEKDSGIGEVSKDCSFPPPLPNVSSSLSKESGFQSKEEDSSRLLCVIENGIFVQSPPTPSCIVSSSTGGGGGGNRNDLIGDILSGLRINEDLIADAEKTADVTLKSIDEALDQWPEEIISEFLSLL